MLLIVALVELLCCGEPIYAENWSSFGQGNDSCAPGFSGTPCKCDAQKYKGMRCDCYRERAYINNGYWVGECENGILCTGKCPLGFCTYNQSTDLLELPGSVSELDDFMCGPTRTGVLCGECRANYSASYHSYNNNCTPNEKCKYGLLLYIVSEFIPLTVMFLVVITRSFSFTSGAVNGFILFAQVQDTLGAHPSRAFPRRWYFLTDQFVYQFFNFNFFGFEELSFCLWRGATVLDTIAFKYVTIACALLLVFFCVYVTNSPRVKRCFPCLRPTTMRSTLIHGLTAFFVMCYSQCAQVSFHVLRPTSLYGKGNCLLKTVVFASGQLRPFEPTHLKYAIPALFFMSTLLLLLPVVLMSYLMCKILARCNLSESKPVIYISRVIPMQLLDSFQSTFRNEARYFAGLYFVYKLAPQIIWAITLGTDDYGVAYSSLTVMFILILALHAVVQPYKRRMHNVLDLLILADLATICALSLLNWQSTDPNSYRIVSGIQLILLYLPLVCLLLMGLFKVLKAVVRYCKTKLRSRQETSPLLLTDSCDLPPLREEKEHPYQ